MAREPTAVHGRRAASGRANAVAVRALRAGVSPQSPRIAAVAVASRVVVPFRTHIAAIVVSVSTTVVGCRREQRRQKLPVEAHQAPHRGRDAIAACAACAYACAGAPRVDRRHARGTAEQARAFRRVAPKLGDHVARAPRPGERQTEVVDDIAALEGMRGPHATRRTQCHRTVQSRTPQSRTPQSRAPHRAGGRVPSGDGGHGRRGRYYRRAPSSSSSSSSGPGTRTVRREATPDTP